MNTESNCNHLLLQLTSGNLLYYFIENNSLYFSEIIDTRIANKEKILDNIDIFTGTLDKDERIHLAYITKEGKLFYRLIDNGYENDIFLKKFNPEIERINKIDIFYFKGEIHIFYSYKNTYDRIFTNNRFIIMHLFLHNRRWKYNYLLSILDHNKKVRFTLINNTNKEILFFYSIHQRDKIKLYCKSLSTTVNGWKENIKIDLGDDFRDIKHVYFDSNENIHFLIYKGRDLYHVYGEPKNIKKPYKLKRTIILENCHDVDYFLTEKENLLYCYWLKDGVINYKTAEIDSPLNWSQEHSDTIKDPYIMLEMGFVKHLPMTTYALGKICEEGIYLFPFINTFSHVEINEEEDFSEHHEVDMNLVEKNGLIESKESKEKTSEEIKVFQHEFQNTLSNELNINRKDNISNSDNTLFKKILKFFKDN